MGPSSLAAKRGVPSPHLSGALHAAVCAKDEARVRHALDHGADVNERQQFNEMTPLHVAAMHDLPKIVGLLLSRGADIEAISHGTAIEARNSGGKTPLYLAAARASPETVALLLLRGASANAKTKSGDTPLHAAAMAGRLASAERLIGAGAALSTTNKNGHPPLYFAVSGAFLKLSALLLAHCPAAGTHSATADEIRSVFAPDDLTAAVKSAVRGRALASRHAVCIAWLVRRATGE